MAEGKIQVSTAIKGFFSCEELTLLRTMGSRLETLSKGNAAPDDAFERRFVTALKKKGKSESGVSRAAQTWRKYKALQKLVDEREFAQLKAQSVVKKLDAEKAVNLRLEEKIQEVTNQLTDQKKVSRAFAYAMKKAVARKTPYEWSASIFSTLPVLEQKTLKQDGWLFLLKERKWITEDDFERICRDLGLWLALQYDEKVRMAPILEERRKLRLIYPRRAALGLQRLERCGACDRPIIDFRCGCSE